MKSFEAIINANEAARRSFRPQTAQEKSQDNMIRLAGTILVLTVAMLILCAVVFVGNSGDPSFFVK